MEASHSTPRPDSTEARIRDLVSSVAEAPPARHPAGDGVSGDAPRDLVAVFAAELRHTRRMAGNPTYDTLAERTRAGYSVPTISRAFAGHTLPRWATVLAILEALGVEIDTRWRSQWAQALDERDPIPGYAPADTPSQPLAAAAGQTPPATPDSGTSCEDCGALIGNPVDHQAWHWRVERQLRKTAIRIVDAAAQ